MSKKIKDLFLPYELAVIAKKKGFDEPCLASYDIDGENLMTNDDGSLGRNSEIKYGIYAPLYQQLVDWLSENHKMNVRRCRRQDEWELLHPAFGTAKFFASQNKAIEEAFKLI